MEKIILLNNKFFFHNVHTPLVSNSKKLKIMKWSSRTDEELPSSNLPYTSDSLYRFFFNLIKKFNIIQHRYLI